MMTRQQQDALLAYNQIKMVKDCGDRELQKTYARAVYRFPILVRQNGMQQTLCFYQGKAADDSGKAENEFLTHIAKALNFEDQNSLMKGVLGEDLGQYMFYSRRCLEVAIWYQRFTQSLLNIDPTGNPVEEIDMEEAQEA